MLQKIAIFFTLILAILSVNAQNVEGFVMDEENVSMPGVRVSVKDDERTAMTNIEGKYNIGLDEGTYELIFTLFGFKTKTVQVTIRDGETVQKNIYLETDSQELEELVIKSSGKNPAYQIIKKVIDNKEKFRFSVPEYKAEIYIKAENKIDRKAPKQKEVDDLYEEETEEDYNLTEEEKKRKNQQLINKLAQNQNLAEINLELHFRAPDNYKEIRNAVDKYGNTRDLYYLSTVGTHYDFYENLMKLRDLSETPLISPLSNTAILSYKYKLLKEYLDSSSNEILYKIKVSPRKRGNATFSGYLIVADSIWNVREIEMTIDKGNMYQYDKFTIYQKFKQVESSWIVEKQEFTYFEKSGGDKINGKTEVNYLSYDFNPRFEKKHFNNELGITTEEAYERDSSYWDNARPEPLTKEQQRYIFVQDSIYEFYNSEEYLDSLDSITNKITFWKVAWFGIDQVKRDKMVRYRFGSLAQWVKPVYIGGPRVGPDFSFRKKWENERFLFGYSRLHMGLRNKDLKGNIYLQYYFNPKKQSYLFGGVGHDFNTVTVNDAILNMVMRSNFITSTYWQGGYGTEFINGLYFRGRVSFEDKQPITGLEFGSFMDNFIPPQDNLPLDFDAFQGIRTTLTLSYVPFQKYITEPKRKVVLGSSWPTIYASWTKGWKNVLKSDIDFDYLLVGIRQKFAIGTFGNSQYHVKSGKFINQNIVNFQDMKLHQRSNKWLYSTTMYAFQNLPFNFPTFDWYFEAHYKHEFNGALTNFIPLVNRLRLRCVASAGTLVIPEYEYQMKELMFGIERVFKIFKQRIGFGVHYFVAQDNWPTTDNIELNLQNLSWNTPLRFTHGIKFSIEEKGRSGKAWNF